MPKYAKVITDKLNRNTDRLFTYRIPPETERKLSVGMRVIVPFGASRRVEGYVLELCDDCDLDEAQLKDIAELCDDYPVLLAEQIELARFMRIRYHSMMAQVLRLFIPAEMRGGRVSEKSVTAVKLLLTPEQTEKAFEGIRYGTKKYGILDYLLTAGECDKPELQLALGNVDLPLKQLEKEGCISLYKREVQRSPYSELTVGKANWLSLNPEQENAYNAIMQAVNNRSGNILIHGITGSGKTEVYMHAIRSVLQTGGTAIMLIPEISLTPQTVQRFRERFGEEVAVLHSALSAGERYDEWRRIRTGKARVVVGARSAVFAPCANLRLIIIDEAHEGSYTAGNHPKYSAVEVARELARLHGGVLVLGSATPSVEQYYSAKNGDYSIVKMLNRANGKPLPKIEVVDMAAELARGNKSVFSVRLYEEMKRTLEQGYQAILFLNRRGHSTVVTCRTCGQTIKCGNCDVSMTYHVSEINGRYGSNMLRCHYCGAEREYPTVCPSCGSKYIKFMGAGTEKVEQEFSSLFPGIGVLRMDNDTTRGKDAHLHILSQFASRQAQVLIGTQMIAKGLDFPKVALVGIISADTMLQLPDYTSREKTYSLITQVAGRAGRADADGTVILQTYTPGHYAISNAVSYGYEEFFEHELRQRQLGWYPPFATIIRQVFFSSYQEKAKKLCFAQYIAQRDELMSMDGYRETVLMLNMMAAPVSKIKGQFRYQIIIKTVNNAYGKAFEQKVFNLFSAVADDDVYTDIEVNPTNLI